MKSIKFQLISHLTRSPAFLDVKGQRLLWLIRLRFIALFMQIPLTLVGRYYGYLDQKNHILFTMTLVVLIIYNSTLFQKVTSDKNYKIESSFLALQVSMDLIIFSFLLHLTGGINNPFYAFFYLMAVFGGIFTTGAGGIVFFVLLNACILFIQTSAALKTNFALNIILNQQTFPYLVTQLLIPSTIFLVAKSFGEFLNKSQQDLMNVSIRAERLDRLRAVGALSAGFSHEFASPLHAAKIRLGRLARILPPDNKDLSECILALDDCDKVLKQMNSSQLQMNNNDSDFINLSSLLTELLDNWKLDYPEIQIEFISRESKIKVPIINFTQSLFNLLDNSAEAMNFKGLIKLQVNVNETEVILVILDQGHGFDPEILSRLGEPFNTNKTSGTGLGLYSTNLFMESVAGKMFISPSEAMGSKIELQFPRIRE